MEAFFSWIAKFTKELSSAIGLEPIHLGAYVLGVVICLALTQFLKVRLEIRGKAGFWTAFFIGSLATYTVAPPVGFGWDWLAFWLAVLAGISAPSLFEIVKAIAIKRDWAIASKFSPQSK